jgi:hypothetical protein
VLFRGSLRLGGDPRGEGSFLPDLQAGPVFGDYAHNVIEVIAGLLCLAGALRASGRERAAWGAGRWLSL